MEVPPSGILGPGAYTERGKRKRGEGATYGVSIVQPTITLAT